MITKTDGANTQTFGRIKVKGAVIVTRVSTGEQVKHGTSLESQREACRAKAEALGLRIIDEFEDAGISGGLLLLREGMQSAITAIKEGRADTLICANMSRYSRDVEHQQKIRKEVRAAGGTVVFCDMHFDDTPEGDLAFNIMGGFAEYERKMIRARTMRGKRKRAEEGQQPARSRAPYGYHIVTHADVTRETYGAEMLGRYVLKPETAEVAKRIFDSYSTGRLSLPKICRELNTERVPTPGGGRSWQEPTLYAMLRNPVYKGQPVAGRIRRYVDEQRVGQVNRINGHAITTAEVRCLAPESDWVKLTAPALVDEAAWDLVQERLPRMGTGGGGNPKQLRMLSGIAYCPQCNARLNSRVQIANKVKYHYYICSNHVKARIEPSKNPCTGDLYPIASAEEAVISAVLDAIQRPDAIKAAIQAYREQSRGFSPSSAASEEVKKIDQALAALKDDETATVRAQIVGIRSGASPDTYAEVFADIAAQRKDLEDRRGVLKRRMGQPVNDVSPKVSKPTDLWQQALTETYTVLQGDNVTGAEKRGLIGTIVERVVCNKEGADVYFVPGLFGETAGDEDGCRSTFQTTCIGIKTQK